MSDGDVQQLMVMEYCLVGVMRINQRYHALYCLHAEHSKTSITCQWCIQCRLQCQG